MALRINKKKVLLYALLLLPLILCGCEIKFGALTIGAPEFDASRNYQWEWLRDWIATTLIGNFTYLFLHTPDILSGNEHLMKFYKYMLGALDIFTVVLFMWQGMKSILFPLFPSLKYVSGGEFIKRVIISAVFANLAIPAVLFLIDMSNKFTNAILKFSLGTVQLEKVMVPEISVAVLFFLIFYVLVLVRLLWFWAYRLFEITLLMGFAPLVFFAWITPAGQKYLGVWWRQLTTIIFAQVFQAGVIVMYYAITTGMAGTGKLNPVLQIVMLMASISFMITTPNYLREFMYSGSGIPDPIATVKGGIKQAFISAVPGGRVLGLGRMGRAGSRAINMRR